jgi:protein-S-isoprenylcysteine O-methyltransferase Ste14
MNWAIEIFRAYHLNPEILNERGKPHSGTKWWDKVFFVLCSLTAIIALPFIAGRDLGGATARYFPWAYSVIGCFVYVGAVFFIQWATYVNRHFEVTVRIQRDRGHKVVADGPYRIIRHPGYAGMMISYLLTPLIMGSVIAFIPALFTVLLFFIRTALEDRTLSLELDGYKEYASRVKYRLIPWVW